jgi:methionyl-tRNA formyltransferase
VVKGSSIAILQCKLIQGAPSYIGVPGEVVGRDSRGNIVKTKDSTLLITKIADVENDGLGNIRVPSFPISTRMGLDMRGRIEALEGRIAELSQTIHELTQRKQR